MEDKIAVRGTKRQLLFTNRVRKLRGCVGHDLCSVGHDPSCRTTSSLNRKVSTGRTLFVGRSENVCSCQGED